MKKFSSFLVFLIVFALVGIGMHFALFSKPGIFVWSLVKSAETGEMALVRTTLTMDDVTADVPLAEQVEADAGESSEAAEEGPALEPVVEDAGAASNDGEFVLLNGEDLGAWEKTQFGGEGDVFINEDGNLEFGFGAVMTGVNWSEAVPATSNYEITLEAMKLDGTDFFCALTFPVKESHATFVIGGWGGGIVGISSVDDLNASENETMNIEGFSTDQWYAIRVRVTDERLEAWIDDDQKVDLKLEGREISLYPGDIELSVPIGIASYITRAQYRNIVWKNLSEEE